MLHLIQTLLTLPVLTLAPVPKAAPDPEVLKWREDKFCQLKDFSTNKWPVPGHVQGIDPITGNDRWFYDEKLWDLASDPFAGPAALELARLNGIPFDIKTHALIYGTANWWLWSAEARYWLLWDLNEKADRPMGDLKHYWLIAGWNIKNLWECPKAKP